MPKKANSTDLTLDRVFQEAYRAGKLDGLHEAKRALEVAAFAVRANHSDLYRKIFLYARHKLDELIQATEKDDT